MKFEDYYRKLESENGMYLYDEKDDVIVGTEIYLGKYDSPDNYKEVDEAFKLVWEERVERKRKKAEALGNYDDENVVKANIIELCNSGDIIGNRFTDFELAVMRNTYVNPIGEECDSMTYGAITLLEYARQKGNKNLD